MNLPTIDQLEVSGKKVIVRADLDVDVVDGTVVNEKRLQVLMPTLKKLLEMNAEKVTVIGHRGRPTEDNKEELSTEVLVNWFQHHFNQEVNFQKDFDEHTSVKLVVFENLRFWKGEEENSEEFVQQLAGLGEVYINEAFGNSHRQHASMVGLPGVMPRAAGLRVIEEVEQLSKVLQDAERPVVSLLSGAKEDKLNYLDAFIQFSDKVLVGGLLPQYLGEDYKHEKVVMARLIQDKEDITLHSVEAFESEIAKAKTILLSGPMGHFEEEGHRQGTQRVLTAVVNSSAYKVAGGGDTEAAISLLDLEEKFDWISIGGGAMLEFISKGTLPAIQALLH